jgi:hypothetical protein
MKKPQGRTIIMIDKLHKPENTIDYAHIEIFENSPLRGLPRKYKPTAGDRIFIYPDSNIPRFKLKNFCEKHKVSIAKAKETANVFFMDPDSANSSGTYYSTDNYAYLMHRSYFLEYVKKATRVGDKRYIQLITDLTNSQEDVIYLEDYYGFKDQGLNKYKLDIVGKDDLEDDDDDSLVNCESRCKLFFIAKPEQKQAIDALIGKDIYHPDALLALLNEGSVVDKEMYDGIMNLFESSDGNDHRVAMEAMANCDYEKSAVYLLMVFYHHQNDIYNSDTKTHVNFKSYLNFFKLQHGRGISIDDIIDRLKDKRLLNSSNLAIVMKEAKKVIKNTIEGDTEYFVFTDIAPTEEIQKEVAETDAEEAAEQLQATIPPTLDSCPGAFGQQPFAIVGLGETQTLLDL